MRNYETNIEVRGLRRADPARAREPIGIGEVIALPELVARDLQRHGAITETKAEPTVELTFDYLKPVAKVGGTEPTTLDELMAAIAERGGVILFPGAISNIYDLSAIPMPDLVAGVIDLIDRAIIEPTDLSSKLPEDLILKEVAFRLQVGTLETDTVRALLPTDQPPIDLPTDPPADLATDKPAASRKKA